MHILGSLSAYPILSCNCIKEVIPSLVYHTLLIQMPCFKIK